MSDPVWLGNYIVPRWLALLILVAPIVVAVAIVAAICGAVSALRRRP